MSSKVKLKQDTTSESKVGYKDQQEKENISLWLKKKSFRLALISAFTALSIVLGYMLATIPNIEVFTLMIFLSGFIMGKRDGLIIGFMSSFIFTFFNPLGTSPLPLLTFQLFFYSLTGFLGGQVKNVISKYNFFQPEKDLYILPVILIFGIIGGILTTFYDFLSTLVIAITNFGNMDVFIPYLITGAPFTIIHLIGNVIGFTFILPGLIQLIYKILS
ncbi:MAG: hypothetical protein P8Y70_09525 [Candidatus Lokiarchaeota archaeon]